MILLGFVFSGTHCIIYAPFSQTFFLVLCLKLNNICSDYGASLCTSVLGSLTFSHIPLSISAYAWIFVPILIEYLPILSYESPVMYLYFYIVLTVCAVLSLFFSLLFISFVLTFSCIYLFLRFFLTHTNHTFHTCVP